MVKVWELLLEGESSRDVTKKNLIRKVTLKKEEEGKLCRGGQGTSLSLSGVRKQQLTLYFGYRPRLVVGLFLDQDCR